MAWPYSSAAANSRLCAKPSRSMSASVGCLGGAVVVGASVSGGGAAVSSVPPGPVVSVWAAAGPANAVATAPPASAARALNASRRGTGRAAGGLAGW